MQAKVWTSAIEDAMRAGTALYRISRPPPIVVRQWTAVLRMHLRRLELAPEEAKERRELARLAETTAESPEMKAVAYSIRYLITEYQLADMEGNQRRPLTLPPRLDQAAGVELDRLVVKHSGMMGR